MAEPAIQLDLSELFEGGDFFADRWTEAVRQALDVDDHLADVVTGALRAGHSVVITGNAGDGKSHLAEKALRGLGGTQIVTVRRSNPVPANPDSKAIVFVRDVSSLSDDEVRAALQVAERLSLRILMTINEGPLEQLAAASSAGWLEPVLQVLHTRTQGDLADDPPGVRLINLADRQIQKSDFFGQALDRILPMVRACRVCNSNSCPRVVGARLIQESAEARERLRMLLELVGNSGVHLTARQAWAFLADLFFNWVCEGEQTEAIKSEGYFWNRAFSESTSIGAVISREFDPIDVPLPDIDAQLWIGRFLELDLKFPGANPSTIAQTNREDGLVVFKSAKRALFFLSPLFPATDAMRAQSLAHQYGDVLQVAVDDPAISIRRLVGMINQYRLGDSRDAGLWVSRHHGLAAHKRATTLAAIDRVDVGNLELSVPTRWERDAYPSAGYFPSRLFLRWGPNRTSLLIDYGTWRQLLTPRSVATDRKQEILDLALDVFMSAAGLQVKDEAEMLVYDHKRRTKTNLQLSRSARSIKLF